MKNYFILILAIVASINVNAQIPNYKSIQNLKDSKVIIGLTSDDKLNKALKTIVNDFWTLCPIEGEMNLKEAQAKAANNDNLYVIFPGSLTSRSFKYKFDENTDYRYVSKGKFIGLSNGNKKPLFRSFIPAVEDKLPKESLAHGINYMQKILSTMLEHKAGAMKALATCRKNNADTKNKTLYIPEMFISKKLTEADIKKYYTPNYKIVSYVEWRSAILGKEKDVIYTMIVPVPVGGDYIYQHHVMDAGTANIYDVVQPKAGVSIQSKGVRTNLSKGNTGYINKKIIKKYNTLLSSR